MMKIVFFKSCHLKQVCRYQQINLNLEAACTELDRVEGPGESIGSQTNRGGPTLLFRRRFRRLHLQKTTRLGPWKSAAFVDKKGVVAAKSLRYGSAEFKLPNEPVTTSRFDVTTRKNQSTLFHYFCTAKPSSSDNWMKTGPEEVRGSLAFWTRKTASVSEWLIQCEALFDNRHV